MILADNNIEIIIPNIKENSVLEYLHNDYIKYSQMTKHEREFINALILRYNAKKLLEIGVSAGCSSLIMLNAIKNADNSKLYSIDYSSTWYKSNDRETGFLVNDYVELKQKWKLYTGGLSINFLEEIGKNIDFCLIDTMHINPGGILDFLMVFPYLKENAIVVLHDTKLNTCDYANRRPGFSRNDITNNILINSIFGKKLIQGNYSKDDDNNGLKTILPNIEGVVLNKNSKRNIFGIINLLSLKWEYILRREEINNIITFFEKHYDKYYIEYLHRIIEYQIKIFME
jgi:predicted O-methyltransferase YrrM